MDIQNQNIPELKPNGLNIFPSIFQLGLSFNNIQKVSNGAFNGLEKVTGLYLNDNNITIIEDGAIDNLVRLRNMDFSLNPIERYIWKSLLKNADKTHLIISWFVLEEKLQRNASKFAIFLE